MHTAENLRKMLAENAAHVAHAKAHGAKIRSAAEEDLDRVNSELAGLTTPDVLTDEVNAHRYRALIENRARLLRLTGG
jgi:hypothetical protein